MEWTFEGAGQIDADVEVPAGSVEVEPAHDGRVVVVLEPADPFSRRAVELVEASQVSMTDGRLRVLVPTRLFGGAEVRCVLTVPAEPSLSFKSASADLRCGIPLSTFKGKTASGDVSLLDVHHDASLSTASGDLSCQEVGGRLQVKGASSDVRVERVGAEVEVALASGDLKIAEATTSVTANTASGDVSISRVSDGRISVNSASGDIVIGVAAGTGAYLDVTSVSGEMDCDLPFHDSPSDQARVKIVCRTVSGDVRIEAAAS